LHSLYQIQILLEVLALKRWRVPAKVVGGKILEPLALSGEKAAPERAVSDKPNAQFTNR